MRHVAATAKRLPDRRHVINLCNHRYHFLVAFAAALTRGHVSLLSSDCSPAMLEQLASVHPDAYTIGDASDATPGFLHVPLSLSQDGPAPADIPLIPSAQIAAIVATSGSTGAPALHAKPWGTLVTCSEAAADRFGFVGDAAASIVGTVPPRHMYGFETTVLLPLHAGASSFAGNHFFPYDIAQALAAVPPPRVLVTTPLQIRALLVSRQPLPELAAVISATAPLAGELARTAERAWKTTVFEIFGATEVGSIASRRTVGPGTWHAYRTVRVQREDEDSISIEVPHLPGRTMLADRFEFLDETSFRLLGRRADLIKLAGKRASLAGLNAILCSIDGIEDGTFFAPDDLDHNPKARLVAFVVAPDRTVEEISAALRDRVERPFLPRRLVKVAGLPRNDVGKITRSALVALHEAARRRN
jgi:acyl-coenzyme A synthetase/AMP-(fatty) acid ligase